MPSLSLHAGAALHPALSPRLQRAVRLLQMSSLDFSRAVRDALDTNPFLETDESGLLPDAGAVAEADGEGPERPPDAGGWGGGTVARARMVDDDGVFDTLVARTSLADHLLGQLNLLPLPERDWVLAAAVIESLDDDGYLRAPLSELATVVPLDPLPEPGELAIALCRVQSLEPAGVGARDVIECLRLQLPSIECARKRELAGRILGECVQCLASRDLPAVARKLRVPLDEAQAACAAIRRLDPRPGWRHEAASVQYVTPDVIVRKVRGQWTALLNDAVVPRVRLNRSYAELFRRHRRPEHAELGAHLQEARWTVHNVEQRFSTILAVAQAILKRQHRFLAYGAMAMKPLALREIAQEVGVHESTVSRVTNNKFMATPAGVFELKYFFSRGLAMASGGECSPTAIRGLIQEMIAAESAAQPLSDVEIARQLDGQGLKVARRTVTKYRQLMKIEPAERRRAAA
ncbi:RNA polymerase factor sigma-54 [Ramlibacter tataouinensis]|uniref:RNA polymerase factor sigma-54 n=1 Tax=Ramlibacter tataouinensis TaxID=94132 RepID=UPI0022F3AD2C|nr:RNA polymerase factor sigma-54 [Ramlibacter tataouinensis]WBY03249.1 RNA polymerase factor sigma-54 [Ramlibacter tataouinensis]